MAYIKQKHNNQSLNIYKMLNNNSTIQVILNGNTANVNGNRNVGSGNGNGNGSSSGNIGVNGVNGIGASNINENGTEENIKLMNSIVNSNISSKYKIIKYLGQGIQGDLYLAIDANNKKYILKKIILNDLEHKSNESNESNVSNVSNGSNESNESNESNVLSNNMQINFELNVLKYLSKNASTKEFINPCIEYKILDNNIYTLFPIFNGYSLQHLNNYMTKLNHVEYYKLVFHLIKNILYGMASIHKTHIAHQNLNENSILVSSYTDPKELYVKFTDFGLGCGNIAKQSNIMNIANYENKNDKFFNIGSCTENSNVPIKISNTIMNQLSESEYLHISQKYDLLCLGMIFLKMLLFFDKLDIDLSKGYNKQFIENIKKHLADTYISKMKKQKESIHKLFTSSSSSSSSSSLFPLQIPKDMQHELMEYIKIIMAYILCKTNSRKSCQYILDKIIIYEKYKNDLF